jgi:hypothetical protein
MTRARKLYRSGRAKHCRWLGPRRQQLRRITNSDELCSPKPQTIKIDRTSCHPILYRGRPHHPEEANLTHMRAATTTTLNRVRCLTIAALCMLGLCSCSGSRDSRTSTLAVGQSDRGR